MRAFCAAQADAESAALLKSLGLSGLSAEEMKVTPSLRNLNQDAAMADALVYYLKVRRAHHTAR